jgi:PAS domain S-box-containing protein
VTYASTDLLYGTPTRSSRPGYNRVFASVLLVALFYYLGAKLGFSLTLRPQPISTLWPPNSILLAALLLTPTNWWAAILLCALPAHLAVELNSGFPTPLIFGWFVSNCSEALIGAGIVRGVLGRPLSFGRSHDVGVFILGAALIGAVLSSFLDAAFVTWSGAVHDGYWMLWHRRVFSNALASLILVPAIVTWVSGAWIDFRSVAVRCYLEAGALAMGLLAVSLFVFNGQQAGLNTTPVSLYAPLPFLLWATIRFGPRGTTASLLAVTFLAIWGAVHGHGPFLTSSPAENAMSIQMFLIVITIPLLILAAVFQERELAENTARENEERLNLALGAGQVGTWEWLIPENRIAWSAKSQQIFGLSSAGQHASFEDFLKMVGAEDKPALVNTIREAVRQGSPYEWEFQVVRPDSSVSWVLGKGKALYDESGKPHRMLGVNVDITERKAVEELRREEASLRESEARLRELADAMPQIVWTATPDGRMDYFNQRWYELTGADGHTISDQTWLLMTHPDDRRATIEAWRHAVLTSSPCEIEHRLQVRGTGDFRWHLARAFPVKDDTGAVVRWYGSCTDIHDQKSVERELRRAHTGLEACVQERTQELSTAIVQLQQEIAERADIERALRSSEERFAKAFHSGPDAIMIVRQQDFRLTEVNARWEAMFGCSRAEALGRAFGQLGLVVHPEQQQRGRAQLLENGYLKDFELETRTRSGEVLQVLLMVDTLEMGGEACYLVHMRDITARKRAELEAQAQGRELAHLSRVASLGELSGALAHELNQPLAAILVNTRAAQRMITRPSPDLGEIREILEDIASDDQRAGDVIARLRVLLKKGDREADDVDLNDLVAEARTLLHSELIRRRVLANFELAPSLPPVWGERVQLQQVVLNLVSNACDAMASTPGAQRQLLITTALDQEGRVQLSVRDRGDGVPEDRLETIFDPFFTTKENGLGLGLAICRSIAIAHEGRLWAENNPTGGATFHLVLTPSDPERRSKQA